MLSISAKKRPIAVSAVAFGPPLRQIDTGANAMTSPRTPTPTPPAPC
jgi:hypothetical protein